MTVRDELTEYLDDQARWREMKAEEHPGDARNQRAADGLRGLAGEVRQFPDDDPLLARLEKLSQATRLGVFELMPIDEATSGVNASKFRFHDPREQGRAFLERLVAGAEEEYVDVHMGELGKHVGD